MNFVNAQITNAVTIFDMKNATQILVYGALLLRLLTYFSYLPPPRFFGHLIPFNTAQGEL